MVSKFNNPDKDIEKEKEGGESEHGYYTFASVKGPIKRSMILLGIVAAIGASLTIAYFFGLYLIQSQKCPLNVKKADDIPCHSDEGMCELFYNSYNEKFAACVKKNSIGIISQMYTDSCDLETTESSYCSEEEYDGWSGIGFILLGFCVVVVELTLILIIILIIVSPFFSSDDNKTPENWVDTILKLQCNRLVQAVETVALVVIFSTFFVYLFQWIMNGTTNTQCKFYQTCLDSAKNCVETDEYCYIHDFTTLQFEFLGILLLAIMGIVLGAMSIGSVGFGCYMCFRALGKWIIHGET